MDIEDSQEKRLRYSVKSDFVMDWLLEDNQPSIRYLTLTRLLGKSEKDPDVRSATELITQRGWAAGILSEQHSGGWWISERSLSRPKYTATYWMLLILSDLCVTN